jgi:hypothetical protein
VKLLKELLKTKRKDNLTQWENFSKALIELAYEPADKSGTIPRDFALAKINGLANVAVPSVSVKVVHHEFVLYPCTFPNFILPGG